RRWSGGTHRHDPMHLRHHRCEESRLLLGLDSRRMSDVEPNHQATAYRLLGNGIADGRWVAGSRLPSVRALAARLGCSITPVHRALKQLAREGLIAMAHG